MLLFGTFILLLAKCTFKGIVSRDSVSTETIGGALNEVDSRFGITRARSHSLAKLSAQMCTVLWQCAVFRPQISRNKITVLRIATARSLNLSADCHRPHLAECIPYYLSAGLGNPQCTCERFAKGLFLLWQTAIFERGA
jgi:hypothetical protein